MTQQMEQRFADLLTEAIHRIRLRESKSVQIVQDEIGYALGREGGSAIHYWRKGHVPSKQTDIGNLARELQERGRFDREWMAQFLECAGYIQAAQLLDSLYVAAPSKNTTAVPQLNSVPTVSVQQLAPFIAGPPLTHPYHFFGRRREVRRIFGLLKRFPLQNTAVIGAYRTGKTSLLHYIKNITQADPSQLRPDQRSDWLPNSATYQWVFVDFQDARMRSQDTLLKYILNALQLPVTEPCDINQFMTTVSRHLQRPTVILMDEIGAGLDSPELDQTFWWSLRSLGSNQTRGRLAFILAAHETPAQLAHDAGKPSPFFNIFGHTLRLGPLTEEEARALIASAPRPFPEADVEWILEQSGRWPSLLQILCQERWAALEDGDDDYWREDGLEQLQAYRHLLVSP